MRDGFDNLKGALTGGISGGMAFKFSEQWTSADTLTITAKGLDQNITGSIDIFPQHVRIIATLPGLLASLAETVAGRVEKQGKILLEHKT